METLERPYWQLRATLVERAKHSRTLKKIFVSKKLVETQKYGQDKFEVGEEERQLILW